jgi:hypothetical protein
MLLSRPQPGVGKNREPAIRLAFETRTDTMNKLLSMIFAASAIALTAGCANRGNTLALNAGVAPGVYDGFYDDYYGPFYDGYWGDDGLFYYSDGAGGFRRDDGNHFRHEGADGFHGIHTGGSRVAGGFRAGGGDGLRAGGGGGRR